MRTAEQDGQFQRVQFPGKPGEIAIEFLPVFELFQLRLGFSQLDHDTEVFELPFGLEERLDFFAERTGFVDQPLRLLAIVPESFPGHLGVEGAQAFLHGGHVKETSATRRAFHRRQSPVF